MSNYGHDPTIHKRVAPQRRTPLDASVSTDDDEDESDYTLCIWIQIGFVLVIGERERERRVEFNALTYSFL